VNQQPTDSSPSRRAPYATVTGERLAAFGQWIVLGLLVGVLCGAASAVFLWLLELTHPIALRHLTAMSVALPRKDGES